MRFPPTVTSTCCWLARSLHVECPCRIERARAARRGRTRRPLLDFQQRVPCGLVCGVGPSGQKLVPGQNHRVDRMAEAGLYDDAKRGIRRVIDPHLRVKDAELDGVDAEVIGILGAATRLGDREAAEEMFRIYNDWLADFCSPCPSGSSASHACLTATSKPP